MGSDMIDCTVEEIAAPLRNAIVGGPFGSDLVSKDYVAAGVPIVRGTNLGHGRWVAGEFAYVTAEKAERLSGNCAKPGDLVFTQRGTLGQVAIVPAFGPDRYLISQSQMKLTADPTKADTLYLYYVFTSNEQQEYIRQNAIQTGVPHTNLGILKRTPLTLPPLIQQQSIGRILGTLDDKIELNRRMNATLEAMARALFQSWFVDFDPVRAKATGQTPAGMDPVTAALFPSEFEDSTLGEIPKGWEVGTLGDVLTTASKGVSVEEMEDTAAYIGLEHMPRRSIALDQWGNAAELESNKSTFKRGDILFGKLRPYFHKVGIAPIDGVCSTDILVLNSKSPAFFGFALCQCASDALIAHATALSNGAKMPRTKWPDLRDYKVALPLEPIAGQFNKQLRPLFDRIIANIHESRALAALRDALLPMLLCGKIQI